MRLDYKWQAAIVTVLALFLSVLDNTIVAVAMPSMRATFHTTVGAIIWVIVAYFLAQTAVMGFTGYITDRVGTRTIFLVSLALFIIGSGLCAMAPTEYALITFRVIQGIGGGALFPTVFTIIYRAFPLMERGKASAVIGGPVLLAPALGPTVGGYLTSTFDWNAIFIINLPVGILAFLLALFVLPKRTAEQAVLSEPLVTGSRFDSAGLILTALSSTILVFGITIAGQLGWGSPLVLGLLLSGGILLTVLIIVEFHTSEPVIDMRLFRFYTFSIASALAWVISAFLIGSLFLLPFFLQNVQGDTPLDAGIILATIGIGSAIGTIISGLFYHRLGPRVFVVIGFILVTLSSIGFTHLTTTTSGLSLQIWLILRGLGFGFTLIPLQTLAISVVSGASLARATSLISITRQAFSAVGVSFLTSYLLQRTRVHNAFIASHPFLRQGCLTTNVQTCTAQLASTMGLNDTFLFIMIATGICIVFAFFVGVDPALPKKTSESEEQNRRSSCIITCKQWYQSFVRSMTSYAKKR